MAGKLGTASPRFVGVPAIPAPLPGTSTVGRRTYEVLSFEVGLGRNRQPKTLVRTVGPVGHMSIDDDMVARGQTQQLCRAS